MRFLFFYIFMAVLGFFHQCFAAVLVLNTSSPGYNSYLVVDEFPDMESALSGCRKYVSARFGVQNPYCYTGHLSGKWWGVESGYHMVSTRPDGFYNESYLITFYFESKCASVGRLNVSTAVCGHDEQKGVPPLGSCVGNPINPAIGNKYQQESDYTERSPNRLVFSRSYNSLDGLWRHNYSTFIRFAIGKLSLVHADGRESFFTVEDDVATAYPNETGVLVKTDDLWVYTSPTAERFTYDANGRLLELFSPRQGRQQLSYTSSQIIVTHETGQSFSFTEDDQHQPLSFSAPEMSITYSYDADKHLTQLVRTHTGQTEQRTFHYEDIRNSALLTGITDERGVRFATWAYDDQSRAISSQHAGGAGLTQVAYNSDGSSTVTNELGKQATYRFQQIGGVKRIVTIEGEPSANCPASNSSYTYNDRGQVLTKTDAKGLITTYAYNDRGLETSRTEATGTPLARTTETEWHPEHFLPLRLVEPERITVYTYDVQGREISRQIQVR